MFVIGSLTNNIKKLKLKFISKFLPERFIDIHIVEHCNLKCRCCAHFAPLAEPECIDLQTLEKEYKNLKPVYNRFFNSIHLLGGEPLLHPQIEEVLKLTRGMFPTTEIQLVTNGLKLLSMPESFYKCCFNNSIKLIISRYNINLNYDEIEKIAKKYNLECEISLCREKFIHHVYDNNGNQNIKHSYKKCQYGGKCINFSQGKIFPCARAAHIRHLNKAFGMNFEYKNGDFLLPEELAKLPSLISKIKFKRFISRPIPFCRYCNMDDEKYETWGVTKFEKSEWLQVSS